MFKTLLIYLRMYRHMLKYKGKIGENRERDIEAYVDISVKTMKIAKYNLEVIGLENIPEENGVLYTPNHQSFFDVFSIVMVLKRQLSFIGKKQFRHFFSVGTYIEGMDGILIDRDNVKSQVRLIRDLTAKLKAGLNVVVFPEGSRSRTGELGEFKSGSYKMALKSKCMIVPITFYDNHEVVQNKGNNLIKMKIDKPIMYEEYKDLKTNEISDLVKSIIEKNLQEGFNRNEATKIL